MALNPTSIFETSPLVVQMEVICGHFRNISIPVFEAKQTRCKRKHPLPETPHDTYVEPRNNDNMYVLVRA